MADLKRKAKMIKSRSGCKACKQKRMKCDEALPECRNCVKRGIDCPGYVRPLKWSTKHERFKEPCESSPHTAPTQSLGNRKTITAISKQPDTTVVHLDSLHVECVSPLSPSIDRRRESNASAVEEVYEEIAASDSYCVVPVAQPGFINTSAIIDDICDNPSSVRRQQDLAQLDNFLTGSRNYSGWRLERPLPLSTFSQENAHADKLMHHYFGSICRVMSCFDSDRNFYRTDIPEALHFSPHMFQCMMSMAAAHLTNYEGEMAVTTLNYQTKAVNMLQEEMAQLALVTQGPSASQTARYQVLLGTIILGMTSAWHDPSAYALSHLRGARLLFRTWATNQALLEETGNPRIMTREESFIVGSMAYWESLASFLIDQSLSTLDYLLPYCSLAEGQRIYPHSWTGISFPMFVYLAQVGTLLRQKRVVAKLAEIGRGCTQSTDADSGLSEDAQKILSQVLSYTLPPMESVESTGDVKTPVSHLCDLAKIYRYVMLLELYQAFPNLRSQIDGTTLEPRRRTQKESQQLVFDLATSALTVMSNLPRGSGIITVLAIAYICAGSALQNTEPEKLGSSLDLGEELDSIRHGRRAVQTWRENVRQHVVHAFRELGIASIQRCAKLVQEVWTRSDIQVEMGAGYETVLPIHWMDVMIEQKLETLYG